MGMKFLNKKGWHTGSLQNIERVWKAEEKEKAENRKLEELQKQLREERDRDEFRKMQIDAGLIPKQERLAFLYDEGLSVGNSSSGGFTALQSCPPATAQTNNSASAPAAPSSLDSSAPGALFEEKPQSANDAWRKLHSDPLLMIRQREQESLARIKNNPVRMAMIRKSVEVQKKDDEARDRKQKRVKSKHKRHSSKHQSDTEDGSDEDRKKKRKSKHKGKDHLESNEDSRDRESRRRHSYKHQSDTEDDSDEDRKRKSKHKGKDHQDSNEDSRDRERRHRHFHLDDGSEKQHHHSPENQRPDTNQDRGYPKHSRRDFDSDKGCRSPSKREPDRNDREQDSRDRTEHRRPSRKDSDSEKGRGSLAKQEAARNIAREQTQRDNGHIKYPSDSRVNKHTVGLPPKHDPSSSRRRGRVPQLSEEERAARLKEMQIDAELHEEQRWKRLKKAEEDDAREATKVDASRGKSFLDDVQKSVYGAEKGGSSTIEESVRRRSHFLQGRTQVDEPNAFRR